MPSEFPLSGVLRETAERSQVQAEELLEASIADLRSLLEGGERSGLFKPDTDPVDLVVQHARQAEMCRSVLQMDNDARAVESASRDGG